MAEPVRTRRRHRRRWWSARWQWRRWWRQDRRTRWNQAIGLVLVLGTLAAVGAAMAWRDFRPAREQILEARAELEQVGSLSAFASDRQRVASRERILRAERGLTAARDRISASVPISLARIVPGLRRQREGLLVLLDDTRSGAQTARELLDRVQPLAEQGRLRNGEISLDAMSEIGVEAGRAGNDLRQLQHPSSGLWGPLGEARRRFNSVAASNAERLTQASDAMGAAHGFLGGHGERRYLMAMQNNTEMRDQGAILAYGVMRFAGGRFEMERHGPVGELRLEGPAPTPIPPGTQEVFGPISPTALWQSVNATADFEWSAGAMVDMYRQATGESLNGVVAMDVPGLAHLLEVTGPVRVPGIDEAITAENAARVLLRDLYQGLEPRSPQGERRERLGDVIDEVVKRLNTGDRDVIGVGAALADASTGGHLRLWSSVPGEEEAFVRTGLGGGPAAVEPDRTFHIAVENRTGTKLDYYVKPKVRQDIELRDDGAAVVHTTVTVDNQAPVGQPPSYAFGPDNFTKEPGDYLAWILLWGPSGGIQDGATAESGLLLSDYVAIVPAGQKREVTVESTIPDAVRDGRLTLRLVPQPRLDPVGLEVHLRAPGWKVTGDRDWQGPWDQVRRLSWEVRR